MKLTPIQVGQLAKHVEKAIREHPWVKGQHRNLWEHQLQADVDADNTLPNYDELQSCTLIDDIILYYVTEEGFHD